MKNFDLVKQIVELTGENGLKKAAQIVLKEYLMQSLLKLGKVFAFGPVNWLVSIGLDWVLNELAELLEEWAKYQITAVLVGNDFDDLRRVFKEKEEIDSYEGLTDEELDEFDPKIRDAARNAFRIGRVR